MTKVLVYLKTGRIIRLDFANEAYAKDSVREFANQSGVIQIDDDFSEYIFFAKDIEFVKIVWEDDE
ncbi:hypothetical protein R3O64_09760 [Corynebacterium hesseae]|uniref:hypothetical protein n=1 Tax=Corynebacterium hesseae TaxID=2913502 RepID=UPI0030CEE5AF